MLRFRNIMATGLFLFLSLALPACGPAAISCNGAVQTQYSQTTPETQYGHLICITSGLDKEVTNGGE